MFVISSTQAVNNTSVNSAIEYYFAIQVLVNNENTLRFNLISCKHKISFLLLLIRLNNNLVIHILVDDDSQYLNWNNYK